MSDVDATAASGTMYAGQSSRDVGRDFHPTTYREHRRCRGGHFTITWRLLVSAQQFTRSQSCTALSIARGTLGLRASADLSYTDHNTTLAAIFFETRLAG